MLNPLSRPSEIAIIYPVYTTGDGGNATGIIFRHSAKPIIIHRPINSVLQSLAQSSEATAFVSHNKLSDWVKHRQMLPIPLSPDLIFVPIHYRTAPHNLHDGCTAYISLAVVETEAIFPERHTLRDKVYFELDNGLIIHTVTNWETFNRHVNDARIVHNNITEQNLINVLNYLRQFLM